MPKNMKEIQEQLAHVKLWGVAAALGALALLLFYGFEVKTYWDAHTQTETMNYQMGQISRSLRGGVGSNTSVDLANSTHKLQQLNGLFDYPQSDYILAILSSTARFTRVTLGSVSAGDPGIKFLDGAQYRSQPMSLTLKGSTDDIYRYLFSLHQQVPVMSVASINLTNTEDGIGSTAEVNLVFYLSPQPISQEQGED
ncbi:MAG: hypothetical protein ACE5Q6_08710 [Dehalococcoidia bacterium]